MAELEKKLSDFQESECKDFELDTSEDQGQKVCPTCVPNPNFVLPSSWWEIPNAYFNEAECEYHVAIYPVTISGIGPVSLVEAGRELSSQQIQIMLKFASEKILKDIKKPYNDDILEQIFDVAFIKDGPYINLDSSQKGPAYLIAVQSFNIDNIDDEDVEEDVESDFNASLEVVVNALTLTRNIRQVRTTLEVYKAYYRLAQQTDSEGFAIRQEGNKAIRISYSEPRKKLRAFKDELNFYLRKKGYAKLQHTGFFSAKRAKSLKFIFKDNGKDYDLDDVYVL